MARKIYIFTILCFAASASGQSILTPPTDSTKEIGDDARFYCVTELGSLPLLKWEHDGRVVYSFDDEIEQNYDPDNYNVTQDGKIFTLIVPNVDFHDGGSYTCRLINDHRTANLVVLGKPQLKETSDSDPDKYERSVNYTCTASFGGPPNDALSPEHQPLLKIVFDGQQKEDGSINLVKEQNKYTIGKFYNVQLTADMDGKIVKCELTTGRPYNYIFDAVKIEVKRRQDEEEIVKEKEKEDGVTPQSNNSGKVAVGVIFGLIVPAAVAIGIFVLWKKKICPSSVQNFFQGDKRGGGTKSPRSDMQNSVAAEEAALLENNTSGGTEEDSQVSPTGYRPQDDKTTLADESHNGTSHGERGKIKKSGDDENEKIDKKNSKLQSKKEGQTQQMSENKTNDDATVTAPTAEGSGRGTEEDKQEEIKGIEDAKIAGNETKAAKAVTGQSEVGERQGAQGENAGEIKDGKQLLQRATDVKNPVNGTSATKEGGQRKEGEALRPKEEKGSEIKEDDDTQVTVEEKDKVKSSKEVQISGNENASPREKELQTNVENIKETQDEIDIKSRPQSSEKDEGTKDQKPENVEGSNPNNDTTSTTGGGQREEGETTGAKEKQNEQMEKEEKKMQPADVNNPEGDTMATSATADRGGQGDQKKTPKSNEVSTDQNQVPDDPTGNEQASNEADPIVKVEDGSHDQQANETATDASTGKPHCDDPKQEGAVPGIEVKGGDDSSNQDWEQTATNDSIDEAPREDTVQNTPDTDTGEAQTNQEGAHDNADAGADAPGEDGDKSANQQAEQTETDDPTDDDDPKQASPETSKADEEHTFQQGAEADGAAVPDKEKDGDGSSDQQADQTVAYTDEGATFRIRFASKGISVDQTTGDPTNLDVLDKDIKPRAVEVKFLVTNQDEEKITYTYKTDLPEEIVPQEYSIVYTSGAMSLILKKANAASIAWEDLDGTLTNNAEFTIIES